MRVMTCVDSSASLDVFETSVTLCDEYLITIQNMRFKAKTIQGEQSLKVGVKILEHN